MDPLTWDPPGSTCYGSYPDRVEPIQRYILCQKYILCHETLLIRVLFTNFLEQYEAFTSGLLPRRLIALICPRFYLYPFYLICNILTNLYHNNNEIPIKYSFVLAFYFGKLPIPIYVDKTKVFYISLIATQHDVICLSFTITTVGCSVSGVYKEAS